MQHICLDTETTGLNPNTGDRIVEIACVELNNFIPTGREYHQYINPQRDMPQEAFNVHGLSSKFLADYPVFSEIKQDFIDFIGDAPLVIHNASFDMKFLNFELKKSGAAIIPKDRAVDSLVMARRKFPGSPASLDALCRRFDISLQSRDLHGALIDTRLLAEVFLCLSEGRSPGLTLDMATKQSTTKSNKLIKSTTKQRPQPFKVSISKKEAKDHLDFIKKFKGKSLWEDG